MNAQHTDGGGGEEGDERSGSVRKGTKRKKEVGGISGTEDERRERIYMPRMGERRGRWSDCAMEVCDGLRE